MSEERFLVTGANGCIGAWVVAQLTGEGTPVVALDASDDDHRLRLLLDDAALAAVARVRGDITDLDALERTLDEHGDHARDPPRRAAGAVLPRRPAARRARQRRRHGQRVRGRRPPRRPHRRPGRLRLLGRRLRRAGGGRDRRRDAGRPEHALRRLQARERGHRRRSTRPSRGSERRPAPAHRLRARAATRASPRRRRSRCSRPPRGSPTRCRSAAPTSSSTRPTSPRRSSPPRAATPDGAELRDVGGPAVHTDEVIAAIARRRARRARSPTTPSSCRSRPRPGGHARGDAAARRASPTRSRRFRDLLARGLVDVPGLTVRTAVRLPLADCGPPRYSCSRKVSGLRSASDTPPGSTTMTTAIQQDLPAAVWGLDTTHSTASFSHQVHGVDVPRAASTSST